MSGMNFLERLLDGVVVEWKPLWQVTTWDKRFNAVDRNKQPNVINYSYLLAADLFKLERGSGDVFLLSTGERTGWTTEELAGSYLREGEVITIPWGKSRPVMDVLKYYKGRFVTADNRIATSNDIGKLLNKYLYYWMLKQSLVIDGFYRGSGIKHPSMADVLDMQIPIPPLKIQAEIVRILDTFTALTAELTAELSDRKKQYNYYRNRLLTFEEGEVEWKTLGEIGKILRGTAITAKEANSGDYPVVGNAPSHNYFHDQSNRIGETIVIARSGVYAGLVSYWDIPIFLTDAFSIHPDNNVLSSKFLYYALKKDQTKIHNMSKGAGVPHVRAKEFESYKVPVPPLEEQARIVALLDKFDTLTNSISEGLPREIALRQKQYEYYRDLLLSFPKTKEEQ